MANPSPPYGLLYADLTNSTVQAGTLGSELTMAELVSYIEGEFNGTIDHILDQLS
jgi:hypothetical protein